MSRRRKRSRRIFGTAVFTMLGGALWYADIPSYAVQTAPRTTSTHEVAGPCVVITDSWHDDSGEPHARKAMYCPRGIGSAQILSASGWGAALPLPTTGGQCTWLSLESAWRCADGTYIACPQHACTEVDRAKKTLFGS